MRRHTSSQPPFPYLVRGKGHADLVADAQQQKTALRAVDGHLADELVKDLRVELTTHRANARFARLALLELGVELLLKVDDIEAGSRAGEGGK